MTTTAAKLFDLSTRHSFSIPGIAQMADILAEVGLTPADVTKDDVRAACELDAADRRQAQRLVRQINASNGHGEWTTDESNPTRESEGGSFRRKPSSAGRPQVKVFGHSATAVLRWMGVNGWDFEDAGMAMHTLGCRLSDTTIRLQMKAGKDGKRGAPAKVTADQARKLVEASK